MSARFLFTAIPGAGHFHPLVPTARALQDRGHHVAFATSAGYLSAVESAGFEHFAVGPDWVETMGDPVFDSLVGAGQMAGEDGGAMGAFARIADMGVAVDVIEAARDWGAEVLIRESTELGGWVAAATLGLPHVVHSISARMSRPLLKAVAGEQLSGLRTAHGLDPDPELRTFYGDLYVDLVPPSLQPAGMRPLPSAVLVRPLCFDRAADAILPSWAHQLSGRPVVYATLGTVFNRTPRLLELIIEALTPEPVELIVTVGKGRNPEELDPGAPNVHVETYIPQTLLFDRCELVITHGGYNTLVGALNAGLPVYCLPLGADQTFNAIRGVELGFGLSVANAAGVNPFGDPIDINTLTVETIRSDVRRILSEPYFRANASRIKDEIASMPAPDHAAELLEGLAA